MDLPGQDHSQHWPPTTTAQRHHRSRLIPVLSGRPAPNDLERYLLALPVRLGGMGIIDPTTLSDSAHSASKWVSTPLYNFVLDKIADYKYETYSDQYSTKREIHDEKHQSEITLTENLMAVLPPHFQLTMTLSKEKGA